MLDNLQEFEITNATIVKGGATATEYIILL